MNSLEKLVTSIAQSQRETFTEQYEKHMTKMFIVDMVLAAMAFSLIGIVVFLAHFL
jgi:type IV secretory pathway TrbL component